MERNIIIAGLILMVVMAIKITIMIHYNKDK
jgi:hypothetical protein